MKRQSLLFSVVCVLALCVFTRAWRCRLSRACPAQGWYANEQCTACYECEPGYWCPSLYDCVLDKDLYNVDCSNLLVNPLSSSNSPRDWRRWPCPAGTYNPSTKSQRPDACIPCGVGTYSASEAAFSKGTCQPCPSGNFSSTLGAATCEACPAGTYSTTVGATSAATCRPCPMGTFSTTVGASSAATCRPCPMGTFSTTVGASSASTCRPCRAGTFSNSVSSSNCNSCRAGTFSPTKGASDPATCTNCPTGTSSNEGSGYCQCTRGVLDTVIEFRDTQWALLSPPPGAPCGALLSIPSGWTVASDDAVTFAMLLQVGSAFVGTLGNESCAVLNSAKAYTAYGLRCSSNMSTFTSLNSVCYSAGLCSSRMLLRGPQLSYCRDSSSELVSVIPSTIPDVEQVGDGYSAVWPTYSNLIVQPGATVELTVATIVKSSGVDTDIYFLLDQYNSHFSDIAYLSNGLLSFYDTMTDPNAIGFSPPNIGFGYFRRDAGTGGAPIFVNSCPPVRDVLAQKNCIGSLSWTSPPAGSDAQAAFGATKLAIQQLQGQFRSNAYKLIVVISDNAQEPVDGLADVEIQYNTVPIFYNPNPSPGVIANYNSTVRSLPLSNLVSGPLKSPTVSTNLRLRTWVSVLSTLVRATVLRITFARMPSTNDLIVTLPSGGSEFGTYQRPVHFRVPLNITDYPISSTVTVLGFGTSTMNFNINRAPIVADLVITTAANTTFTLNVVDPDGNLIRTAFLAINDTSLGVIYHTSGNRTSAVEYDGRWYPGRNYMFSPSGGRTGVVSIAFIVNDGCLNSTVHRLLIKARRVVQPSTATSQNLIVSTRRNTPVTFTLPANDTVLSDGALYASIVLLGVGSTGNFYLCAAMNDSCELNNGGLNTLIGYPRQLWYMPARDEVSTSTPSATLQFKVGDHIDINTAYTYTVSVFVQFVHQRPQWLGATHYTIDEDNSLSLFPLVQSNWYDDLSVLPENQLPSSPPVITLSLKTVSARGSFSVCVAKSPCERIYPDTNGSVVQLWITDLFARIVFAPEPDEWGAKYANLTFTLTDSGYPYGPSLSVDVIVTINVNPVNDPPWLQAQDFTTDSDAQGPWLIQNDQRVLSWRLMDKDSLPDLLLTRIFPSTFSRVGWAAYQCGAAEGADARSCLRGNIISNNTDNFRSLMASWKVVNTSCSVKEGRPATNFTECYAEFKLVFVPERNRQQAPYVQYTLIGYDQQDYGPPAATSISVLPINQAPYISAPALITSRVGISEMAVLDNLSRPDSSIPFTIPPSYPKTNGIFVWDRDSHAQATIVRLIVQIVQGDGAFKPGGKLQCEMQNDTIVPTWFCDDTLDALNANLKESLFSLNTSVDTSALIVWTIDDLGSRSPAINITALNASATTTFVYIGLPAISTSSSSDTPVSVITGVAAAGGIIAMVLLGWRYRKRFGAPSDRYFTSATWSISGAAISPLYKQRFEVHNSPVRSHAPT